MRLGLARRSCSSTQRSAADAMSDLRPHFYRFEDDLSNRVSGRPWKPAQSSTDIVDGVLGRVVLGLHDVAEESEPAVLVLHLLLEAEVLHVEGLGHLVQVLDRLKERR